MTVDQASLPARRADVRLVHEGHDCVLATPGATATHLLNPTARALWELCDGTTEPREMVAAVCELFSVSYEVAASDVGAALEALTHAGLVTWGRPGRQDES
jgi:hypothetical protein